MKIALKKHITIKVYFALKVHFVLKAYLTLKVDLALCNKTALCTIITLNNKSAVWSISVFCFNKTKVESVQLGKDFGFE